MSLPYYRHVVVVFASCWVMGVGGTGAKTDNKVLAVMAVAILGTVFTLIEVTLKTILD